MKVRNTFIIFIVSGFWHGANWTFIVWGALNAIYFLPLLLTNNNRNNLEIVAQGKYIPNMREFASMLLTFSLTVFAWIFFRASDMSHAFSFIAEILSPSLFTLPEIIPKTVLVLIAILLAVEWLGREGQYAIERFAVNWSRPLRWSAYLVLIYFIIVFGRSQQEFIYFQF